LPGCSLYKADQPLEIVMPTMSDSRRKGIQARQRKAANALKRAAKSAKRAVRRKKMA
jgi:hypothetical protein